MVLPPTIATGTGRVRTPPSPPHPDSATPDLDAMVADLDAMLSDRDLTLAAVLEHLSSHPCAPAGVSRAWVSEVVDGQAGPVICSSQLAARSRPEVGDVEAGQEEVERVACEAVRSDAPAQGQASGVAMAAIPIRDAGVTIGALTLARRGAAFDAGEVVTVRAMAVGLARALQRSQAASRHAFMRRQGSAVRTLLEKGARAASVGDAGVTLAAVSAEALGTELAGVYLIDGGGIIDLVVGVGIETDLSDALRRSLKGKRAADSPVWCAAAAAKGPILVSDASSASTRPGGFVHTLGFVSYVAVPLLASEGPIGLVIIGDASRRRIWTAEDRAIAEQLAWEGTLVVESARLRAAERSRVASLTHRAFHDPMTGLANRALLMERLGASLASGPPEPEVALLLLDLDGFKQINDTLGHHHGDVLLQAVADRICTVTRQNDTVARLGGDEFLVLLESGGTPEAALSVASKIEECLHAPVVLDGLPLRVTASIGIACSPAHGNEAAALLQHADVAMYEAKRQRQGPVTYDSSTDTATVSHLALYTELHRALQEDELRLHYQPKMDLRTGEMVGVEALVRWAHPQRGLLVPGEFLPVAEATGLIERLTDWVLRAASQQWWTWRETGFDVDLAINVSARDLRSPDFTQRVADLTEINRRPGLAERLVLEVTETVIVGDPAQANRVLDPLRGMGVRISIDDFGSGYSSLAELQSLAVDEIKMDRVLVRDCGTRSRAAAIVRSVIDLGHRVGLEVVAEGIEDAAALSALRAWGCDSGQGFHLGRPQPPQDLPELIRGHRRRFDGEVPVPH
ncbi:MAG: hypothetical protein NVS3B12_15770 [Acidimicrobiales bacterium]